jgi:hypothetical protein
MRGKNANFCMLKQVVYTICTHPQISLGMSRRMRWAGHVARMGEERKLYKVLVGKPEGKRPLGRPKLRWEDGIKMDHREISWRGVDWIRLTQDRDQWRAVVNAVMNLRVLTPRSYYTRMDSTMFYNDSCEKISVLEIYWWYIWRYTYNNLKLRDTEYSPCILKIYFFSFRDFFWNWKSVPDFFFCWKDVYFWLVRSKVCSALKSSCSELLCCCLSCTYVN